MPGLLFSDAEALEDARDHVLARGAARELAEGVFRLLYFREYNVGRHAALERVLCRTDAIKRAADGVGLTGVCHEGRIAFRRGVKRADRRFQRVEALARHA